MTAPLGHPENPRTRRAAVDSVLLIQAIHRGDDDAQVAILANCDPFSVAAQLVGFLLATMRQYNVDIDQRLDIWRAATAAEAETREAGR